MIELLLQVDEQLTLSIKEYYPAGHNDRTKIAILS